MSNDQDNYAVGGFREYQDGKQERDPDQVHPHTGFVRDEEVDKQLSLRDIHHNPNQWEGKAAKDYLSVGKNKDILRVQGSETARNALDNGDTLTLKHYIGDPHQQADMAAIKDVTRMQEIVAGPAPIIVILGDPGDGKTELASLLLQLRDRWTDGELLIGSNVRTLPVLNEWERDNGDLEDGWIPNFPLLDEWVRQDGDPIENKQQPKAFLGDEFSTNASGTGKDGQEVRKKMGPLVFKIRKFGGMLVYIGHDESSIHPLLWRLGTIIKKKSQKKAVVADRISNGKLQDVDPRPLENIPPSDWSPHTKDTAPWSWTAPTGDDDEGMDEESIKRVAAWTMADARDRGVTPRETAKFVPYTHTTVRNWLDDIDKGGEKADWVSAVNAAIA